MSVDVIDYEIIGDDLQAVIAMLKGEDLPIALAYQNFRD